jgi:hypothetical protein
LTTRLMAAAQSRPQANKPGAAFGPSSSSL